MHFLPFNYHINKYLGIKLKFKFVVLLIQREEGVGINNNTNKLSIIKTEKYIHIKGPS